MNTRNEYRPFGERHAYFCEVWTGRTMIAKWVRYAVSMNEAMDLLKEAAGREFPGRSLSFQVYPVNP